ncbi:MAG: DUF1592 domain-containing protein [Myxococcales bacterium]|nr:DUF1592 domain-containing protein [Myxococcales bacterium]
MGKRRRPLVALSATLALSGCYFGTQDLDVDPDLGPGDTPADEAGTGEDESPDDVIACDGTPDVAAAPMRRLTRLEYDNTIRDLLLDDSRPAQAFSPDEEVAGFAANSVAKLSKSQLDEYVTAAEDLAHAAVDERWDALVGCDAAGPGCVDQFVARFGRRAFRRPLTAGEQADYLDLHASAAAEWGEAEAVALVIQAMLLSPHFLYHVEPSDAPGVQPVSPFSLASRISYFAWASMPDDALLDAAEAGELDEPAGVEEQVRRLLADERAADAIASFHRQWLQLQGLAERVKDAELFPEWSPSLGQSMEQETLRFVDEVIRRGDGSLHTLLTASWTVADAALADLYGVAAPQAGFGVVSLPEDERSGLLTHASFLTSTAHAAENSWVYRGKFVRERLLCQELPPPPPGVEINEVNDPDRLENPECNYCHLQMDPIGKGFDAYTPIGAFEPEAPDGTPVPTAGEVRGVPEVGTFDGAVELAQALADAPLVHECVAEQWFQYAARRQATAADACALDQVVAAFEESGQDIRELMVAVAVSDAFRYQLNE